MLSKKTKYGLKALMFIARQTGKSPVQASAIGESDNI